MRTDDTLKPSPAALAFLEPSALVVRTLVGSFVLLILVQTARFAGLIGFVGERKVADFEVFHLVGRLVWSGELDSAYHAKSLLKLEKAITGTDIFMPWTYPPPFDLVVAPLGLLPLWLAYLVFMAGTLAAFLLVLRRLSGEAFGAVLIATFPALFIALGCGQNGFLTGTLVGLTCLGLLKSGAAAGLPLGLMVIKPHLAACLGLYTLLARRWTVAAAAAGTVAALLLASTIAFGWSVWSAFAVSLAESRVFLEHGVYPLYRMISAYAVLRSSGAPAAVALAGQMLVAGLAVFAVWIVVYRRLPARPALGLAAMATLLVSPYAYDYDLPIFAIGLALVMPEVARFASLRERVTLFALIGSACAWGMAQTLVLDWRYGPAGLPADAMPLSLGGAALIAGTWLCWRVVRRAECAGAAREHLPGIAASAT